MHRSLPISRDKLEESYGAAKYYSGGYMQRPQHLSTWTPGKSLCGKREVYHDTVATPFLRRHVLPTPIMTALCSGLVEVVEHDTRTLEA